MTGWAGWSCSGLRRAGGRGCHVLNPGEGGGGTPGKAQVCSCPPKSRAPLLSPRLKGLPLGCLWEPPQDDPGTRGAGRSSSLHKPWLQLLSQSWQPEGTIQIPKLQRRKPRPRQVRSLLGGPTQPRATPRCSSQGCEGPEIQRCPLVMNCSCSPEGGPALGPQLCPGFLEVPLGRVGGSQPLPESPEPPLTSMAPDYNHRHLLPS